MKRLGDVLKAVAVLAIAALFLLGAWEAWETVRALRAAEAEVALLRAAEQHALLEKEKAVIAKEAAAATLGSVLRNNAALQERVEKLLATIKAVDVSADATIVESIVHHGTVETLDTKWEWRPGFQLVRVATSRGLEVLEGVAYCDASADGWQSFERVQSFVEQDLTTWLKLPTAEAPAYVEPCAVATPAPARAREWLALQVDAGVSWRRADGDLDGYARALLYGPQLRALLGAQPYLGVEAELSSGALQARYLGGLSRRWGWRR